MPISPYFTFSIGNTDRSAQPGEIGHRGPTLYDIYRAIQNEQTVTVQATKPIPVPNFPRMSDEAEAFIAATLAAKPGDPMPRLVYPSPPKMSPPKHHKSRLKGASLSDCLEQTRVEMERPKLEREMAKRLRNVKQRRQVPTPPPEADVSAEFERIKALEQEMKELSVQASNIKRTKPHNSQS